VNYEMEIMKTEVIGELLKRTGPAFT